MAKRNRHKQMTATSTPGEFARVSSAFQKAGHGGQRVTVTHAGVRAAVVPEEDLLLLEAIENYLDIKDIKRRRKAARARAERPIPYEKARKLLHL